MTTRSCCGLLLVLLLPLCGGSADPGLRLELDRGRFELTSIDLRDGSAGPRLRVALGSPAHQTPAGSYPLYQVVRDPAWKPGPDARALGAERLPPSPYGPMGVAKLPFGAGGYALHGGAHPLLLGKPVSLGCVRTADADLLALLDWFAGRSALGAASEQADGERHQPLLRRVRLVIR